MRELENNCVGEKINCMQREGSVQTDKEMRERIKKRERKVKKRTRPIEGEGECGGG